MNDDHENPPDFGSGRGPPPAHEGVRQFELPEGLDPDEERAVIAALERYFDSGTGSPDPWALAGRLDATGMGTLQTRGAGGAWRRTGRSVFARRGVAPYAGRGDAR